MDIEKLQKNPPYAMIVLLFIGAFVALLNNTLLNVALPSIMKDFDVEASTVQWLTTGYMLVSGVLVPASAFFITRIKNRTLFITSLAIFTLGTALAVWSPTFGVLLTARMIQAVGSAVMGPLLMNIMLISFPIEKRGAVMGVFGLVMITAPAIGPTLSGWIVETWTWHVLFEMILPLAIIVLIVAFFKFENIMPTKKVKLSITSLTLSTIGFGGLLYGFSSAGTDGWDAIGVWGTITVGAIALIAFVSMQLNMKEPMLNFGVYKYPMFGLASVISIVVSMAMFSGMILTPVYLQNIRGFTPLDSGLLMLPGAVLMGIMSPITGKLFDKFGPKILAITGLTIVTISTYYLSQLSTTTTYTYLMIAYTIRMFGMSMVMMPIMTNGLNQLPQQLNPHGTAMNNTLQQIAGAIGSAVMITIMTNRTKSESAGIEDDVKAQVADKMKDRISDQVAEKAAEAAQAGTPMSKQELADYAKQLAEDPSMVKYAKDLAAQISKPLVDKAMVEGINFSFLIAMFITIFALFLAFFLKRVKVTGRKVPPTKAPVEETKE
ncbi:DHA2 family efflux MFS transporter permease subunit [Kurthia zopfii]|uniref:DHA2 family efflux MFS transporter permease subunit n=1 Tax=Kurthia zopfii TaxID=1650 RepID=UPI000F6BA991|nr:DHA2 family efflux MFS transporter permease subunit [Kurthia zopfii]VEI06045.1 Spectinomycin tetracycline efflux pump [Kurthia zopfii]